MTAITNALSAPVLPSTQDASPRRFEIEGRDLSSEVGWDETAPQKL